MAQPRTSSQTDTVHILREIAQPGDALEIGEITTLTRRVPVDPESGSELIQDIEIAKRLKRVVVQVDPRGEIERYRKDFGSFRQTSSVRVGDSPVQREAQRHPLEGRSAEYIWRGDAWEVRLVEGEAGVAPPSTWSSRRHPFLPEGGVRIGETWTGGELPLSIPDVEQPVPLTFTLTAVQSDGDRAIARVDFGGAMPKPWTGKVEGHYEFRVDAGRFVRIQMQATLERPEESLRITTYRAFGDADALSKGE